MNEIEIIIKSIRDFFTSSMLKIALIPLIVTMIILYMLFFAAADFGITSLQEIAAASQNGEEVAPSEDVLKIKNYIFGMKQSGFFWPFLGIMELLAGILLISQVFSRIGAFVAFPLTLNIFLFHLFLEAHEIGELILTFTLFLATIVLIGLTYEIWKPLLYDKKLLKIN